MEQEYEIVIPGIEPEEEVKFTLKYPTLNAYSIAMSLEDTNPLKGKLVMLNDMFVDGDRRILEPDKSPDHFKLFLRAVILIDRIIDLKLGIVKKK